MVHNEPLPPTVKPFANPFVSGLSVPSGISDFALPSVECARASNPMVRQAIGSAWRDFAIDHNRNNPDMLIPEY